MGAKRWITCRHTSYVFSRAWTVPSRACGQEKQHAARKGSSSATFGGHRNQPSTIVISSHTEADLHYGLQYEYTWHGKIYIRYTFKYWFSKWDFRVKVSIIKCLFSFDAGFIYTKWPLNAQKWIVFNVILNSHYNTLFLFFIGGMT